MKFTDTYRIANNNLKRSRTRTFLTTSGVVVSISAIVLLVSLGIGLQQLSISRIASINALTRLTVTAKEGSNKKLDDNTLAQLSQIPNVRFISPELQFPARITFLNTQTDAMVIGIKKEFLDFSDIAIDAGQPFRSNNSEEVLVSRAVLKLFGKDKDPAGLIGKKIDLLILSSDKSYLNIKSNDITVTIVGTTKDEALSSVYLPLNLLKTSDIKEYSSFSIKIIDRRHMKSVKQTIESLGLQTTTVSDLIDQIDQAFLYFQIILGIIGGIALFVAAIGIVNTMIISLLERTKEIGIMKAVGARDGDIRKIFIFESAMIGFKGGLIGLLIGWLIGQSINYLILFLLRYNNQSDTITLFVTPYKFAITILIISVILSILAGVYPARRAARLSPIQALRSE